MAGSTRVLMLCALVLLCVTSEASANFLDMNGLNKALSDMGKNIQQSVSSAMADMQKNTDAMVQEMTRSAQQTVQKKLKDCEDGTVNCTVTNHGGTSTIVITS